ncbi:MAG: A/G-specific adenine glycosylase [Gammaproteobacteria bacterium]|nr:A/G-specific adenine glycosylase [Gammaproteobacteria bacterium]MDE2345567.1 A/G-specific adenine glycosylase [Gammaproteobacteria bacterium]
MPRPAELALAKRLLRWHRGHGRHDLPWQQRRTPYRVWISEIMLQQTRVSSVIPYYQRFLTRFPDVESLAAADPDEVLHLWSGLGYYARARNLQRTAQRIRDQHAGVFPRDIALLAALPGIGRSTAAAILALAFGERHAILDGNVKRVLARVHAVRGWAGSAAVSKKLWALAERHTPAKNLASYTQAIMDLGATVCTRLRPQCPACPLAAICIARRRGMVSRFPAPRPRKNLPLRQARLLLITCKHRVLLEKRPPAGVWGGLWGFPELPADRDATDWCRMHLQVSPQMQSAWPVLRHSFTHFHLDIQPLRLEVPEPACIEDNAARVWYDFNSPARIGLAAPVKKLLAALHKQAGESRHDTHGSLHFAG